MSNQGNLRFTVKNDSKANLRLSESAVQEDISSRDALELARSGKKGVLIRRFGLTSMIGFSCGLMCTWEGMLVAFLLGFSNGGPAGLIYGFFVIWLGTLSVFITMGELASMMPTAGGQYHWVSILAQSPAKKFLSYMTAWVTICGWAAGTAAASFFVSSLIQGLMVLNNPNYEPKGWHGTLIFWSILVICVIVNTVLSRALPAIEIAILILHFLGFFAVLIPLVYLAPKGNSRDIFTVFQNLGGWKTQTLSFFIGLNGNAVAFVGTDGAIHMSEEVQNASKNVPRSMIASIIINGFLAFAMLLAVLFCTGDIENAVENAPNGFPFIAIFASGVGSNAGATAMTAIVLVLELCSAAGALAAASRMLWSFARDRGLPGHTKLSQVDRRTTIPLLAVLVVFIAASLLGLINIGNTTAFNAVISLVLESFYISYLLACGTLLYRRLRGEVYEQSIDGIQRHEFEWGPWRVKGALGTINNMIACIYLTVIAFFSYWPTTLPVTPANMNYSSLVLGFVTIFSLVYYFFWARKVYTGPVTEIKIDRI